MSKATAARRLAAATVLGGGGVGLLGGSVYALLRTQARLARRRIGDAVDRPPDCSGLYGGMLPGRPIRLAVLGDSAAAGYGARVPQETFGAFLATGLSRLAQRPVRLLCTATVGAQTTDLAAQVPAALTMNPDVCVVIVGTNDVTHAVRPSQSIRALRESVQALRAERPDRLRPTAPEVVVGTCPDLGTVTPIAVPLRQLARRWSRRLAAAQTITVVQLGARSVSLGAILGPEFEAAPLDLFGPDRFHPSVEGYRRCATAMLPSVATSIGVLTDGREPEPFPGEGDFALARAAAVAADRTGVEVAAEERSAGRGGRAHRWVARSRQRVAIPDIDADEVGFSRAEPVAAPGTIEPV